MNNQELTYELNKDNKFFTFISSISETYLNKSFIDLLEFNYDFFKDDLNKPIYKIESEYSNYGKSHWVITAQTPASKIFDLDYDINAAWNTGFPLKVLSFFKEKGLDFTKPDEKFIYSLNEKYTFENDLAPLVLDKNLDKTLNEKSIEKSLVYRFSNVFDESPSNDKLSAYTRAFYDQVSENSFKDTIDSLGLLHNAVEVGNYKLVNVLVNELGINPNLLNKDGKTPLMLCKDVNTFESLISNEKTNLLIKDNSNRDCLYYYGLLDNKKISNLLVNLWQAEVTLLSKTDSSIENSLKESNKDTLLAMVKSDKNKKEIEDFIKKSGVKDIGTIYDDENRSLSQLCLLTDNWAKYLLFKDSYPKNHKDSEGFGNIEYLFIKDSPKFASNAVKAAIETLKDVQSDSGISLIKRFFVGKMPFSSPKWFLTTSTVDKFLEGFVGKDNLDSAYVDEYLSTVRKNPHFTNLYTVEPDSVNLLKELVKPYFIHAINNNNISEINELDLSGVFDSKESIMKEKSAEFSANLVTNILVINSLSKDLEFDAAPLMKRFEDAAIQFVQDSHKIMSEKFANNDRFYYEVYVEGVVPLLSTLVDLKSNRIPEVLTGGLIQDIREFLGQQSPVVTKLESSLLELQLPQKDNFTGNTKKMKI